jgi:hypothetical protein
MGLRISDFGMRIDEGRRDHPFVQSISFHSGCSARLMISEWGLGD